jgi:hypothetical protein
MRNLLQKQLRPLAATLGLATILAAPAAANTITFAQYFENTGNQEWTISNSSNTITITASGDETFRFSNTGTALDGKFIDATFNFSATSTTAGNCGSTCGQNDSFSETGYSGTFSFVTPFAEFGLPANTNLLSGTFNVSPSPAVGATLNANVGAGSATINASTSTTAPTQLVLTSAVVNLSGQTSENLSFSLSSVNPPVSLVSVSSGTGYPGPGPFTAAGTGTFATQPGFVPEAGSMLLTGFGLCGIAAISRRIRARKVVS